MAGKDSDPRKSNVLQWLYDRSEETVSQVVEDILGRKEVSRGVGNVAVSAAKTKGRLDRNLETLLHLLNVPSRTDYHKLLVKVEHLQGSVVNLSLKLDRLLASLEAPKKPKAPKPRA